MQTIIKSKIFIFSFLAIALVSFVFFLGSSQKIQSEIDILLIPKNKITALGADKIQNDTQEIIRSLSFYDQLLQASPDSTELSLGRTSAERKNDWQKIISVKKSDNTNILKIFTAENEQKKAEVLSWQVARQISDTMSQYYNIKSELEIRIIDGPVTQKKLDFLNIYFWILSLLFALAGGLIAFLFVNSFEFKKTLHKIAFKKISTHKQPIFFEEEPYIFNEEIHPKENVLENIEIPEISRKEKYLSKVVTPEVFIPNAFRKSAAPENLPFADDLNLNFAQEEKSSETEIAEILEKAHDHNAHGVREATPAEVKARLNRLLRGDL